MPKTRIWRRGFKSIAVRIKNKIGGRKSKKGAEQLSTSEINEMLGRVRKRDRNKLRRVLEKRDKRLLWDTYQKMVKSKKLPS